VVLLADMKTGKPKSFHDGRISKPRLKDLGVTEKQSHRWRAVADGAASLDARLQDIRPKPGFLVALWAQNLGRCRVYTLYCYLNRFLEGVTAIGARDAIGDFANHARLLADSFCEL